MCTSQELRLLDCPVSTQLGLIEDPCACNGCAESLAVRCPGDYNNYDNILYILQLY